MSIPLLFTLSICLIIKTYNCAGVEQCNRFFNLKTHSIIQTHKSEANGAVFLRSQQTSSVDDCYSLCCSIPSCTVSVYENKKKRLCYLFNCLQPNVCTFTEHNHYVVIMATGKEMAKGNSVVIKPQKVVLPPPVTQQKSTKRPPTSTAIKQPSPQVSQVKNLPPALLGEACGLNRQCHVKNAICSRGKCVCDAGFISKHSKCVTSVCRKPDLMFQCDDVSRMPNCVAVYDRCNRVAECGDGSDELGCPSTSAGKFPQGSGATPPLVKPPAGDHKSMEGSMGGHRKASVGRVGGAERDGIPSRSSSPSRNEAKLNQNIAAADKPLPPEASKARNRIRPDPVPPSDQQPQRGHVVDHAAEKQLLDRHSDDQGGQKAPLQQMLDKNYNNIGIGPRYQQPIRNNGGSSRTDIWEPSDYDPSPMVDRWGNSGPVIPNNDVGEDPQGQYPGRQQLADEVEDWYRLPGDARKYPSSAYDQGGGPSYKDEGYADQGAVWPTYQNPRPSEGSMNQAGKTASSSTIKDRYSGIFVDDDSELPNKIPDSGLSASNQDSKTEFDSDDEKSSDNIGDSSKQDQIGAGSKDLEMLKRSNSQERIAVIALSLGLVITGLLAAFTGLRIRTIRRRIRRGGKTLAADEAEHLMNGLYL